MVENEKPLEDENSKGDEVKKVPGKGQEKRQGKGQRKEQRTERRFASGRTIGTVLTMAGTLVGGFVLGTGTYGQWYASPSVAAAPWLILAGAALLVAVAFAGDLEGLTLRVGDGGIAWERGGKVTRRVGWCDLRSVGIRDGVVRLELQGQTLTWRVATNPVASAWVAKEAQARIPSRWKAEKSVVDALLKTSHEDGEILRVEPLQIAGRACKASKRPITFERDACYCQNCGEAYHREEQPVTCLTCERPFRNAS